MLVKVISRGRDAGETGIECVRYSVKELPQDPKGAVLLVATLAGELTFRLEKTHSEVHIISPTGAIIDRYSWPGENGAKGVHQ